MTRSIKSPSEYLLIYPQKTFYLHMMICEFDVSLISPDLVSF